MERLHVVLFAISMCVALGSERRLLADNALQLTVDAEQVLHKEPILVTLDLESSSLRALPAKPGKSDGSTLRFEIEPAAQPRKKGRPLPLEAASATGAVTRRNYDLLEWYVIPEGKFSVRAVLEHGGKALASGAVAFSVRAPAKGDPEHDPVGRIHHLPWTNYDTNKYCGDTFDLVKRWPSSRLAKHCHYWNGRFLQNNKEYKDAIASYPLVTDEYPRFALTDDAAFGIVQCLAAQGQAEAARKQNAAVLKEVKTQSAVGVLAKAMAKCPAGDAVEKAK
jgi:hypothetical protein